jgi:hypothetical protein
LVALFAYAAAVYASVASTAPALARWPGEAAEKRTRHRQLSPSIASFQLPQIWVFMITVTKKLSGVTFSCAASTKSNVIICQKPIHSHLI